MEDKLNQSQMKTTIFRNSFETCNIENIIKTNVNVIHVYMYRIIEPHQRAKEGGRWRERRRKLSLPIIHLPAICLYKMCKINLKTNLLIPKYYQPKNIQKNLPDRLCKIYKYIVELLLPDALELCFEGILNPLLNPLVIITN